MERAEFVFQIFFDTMELNNRIEADFIIMYRLFMLPAVEVFRSRSPPGTVNISEGKRMMLKIPQAEIIEACPIEITVRAPRPGHTSVRLAQDRIKLSAQFEKALQNPNRYVQAQYIGNFKGKRDDDFGSINFTVSVCYTSASMRDYQGPPLFMTQGSNFNEKNANTKTKSRLTSMNSKRSPLIPEIPETRTRSIFYFDKKDLLEENRILAEEIEHLTNLVQRLHDVVDQYEVPKKAQTARSQQKRQKTQYNTTGGRTDFIYHPPGINKSRGDFR
ncbi:hypothetical protein TVAG_282040 [Trichomonas vaginalis G3]|uniref:Uncharacterized protein n=1 Tax=Trichomonas vaginalis (strain ATCC PRA-98 / G3) TaxID=412133 RepID=A2E9R9_TRIV3|nr:hypothetical protein TVAGG3_0043400 [Trichomonas vaginalis G3]EAY10604.1 hypothetical protein TVAG_282040 [Trichomonas vaginalis G3]KAI5540856.1 hypothetical protein TVAGG3_0043400 [Trichomonas vaginalis G3]|eukprot:XP_001322827.1 hypothetical protein [Trichomonas vaginalis G3]